MVLSHCGSVTVLDTTYFGIAFQPAKKSIVGQTSENAS